MSYRIITVSRQFGSGGRSIAKELANRLGYEYYDKEIIESVARQTGFSEEFVAEKGERAPGKTLFSFSFDSMNAVPGVMGGMSPGDYIWSEQSKIIRQIADDGKNCVIVGRSADYILREYDKVLNVYISADLEFRKKRIVDLYGETSEKPEKRLKDMDKRRSLNHKYFTDMEWGAAVNYDICLSSSTLGIDKCVDILEGLAKG